MAMGTCIQGKMGIDSDGQTISLPAPIMSHHSKLKIKWYVNTNSVLSYPEIARCNYLYFNHSTSNQLVVV